MVSGVKLGWVWLSCRVLGRSLGVPGPSTGAFWGSLGGIQRPCDLPGGPREVPGSPWEGFGAFLEVWGQSGVNPVEI